MDKDKKRILDAAKNALKKKWGSEVFVDANSIVVESFPTGSPMLDDLITGGRIW